MIREAVWEEPMRAQPAGGGANTPSKLVSIRAKPFSDALTGRDRLPISCGGATGNQGFQLRILNDVLFTVAFLGKSRAYFRTFYTQTETNAIFSEEDWLRLIYRHDCTS